MHVTGVTYPILLSNGLSPCHDEMSNSFGLKLENLKNFFTGGRGLIHSTSVSSGAEQCIGTTTFSPDSVVQVAVS